MAQDNGGRRDASEDTSAAREHMRNVQENTQALADQAHRVDATAPAGTDRPVQGVQVDGIGGEDSRMAAENQREVRENTEALREQARRVEATTPDDVNRTGPQDR
jgi:phosphomevalonate kinase